ncbi:MAG TPA: hypothetical protein VF008_12640, partial [Niastella sp.]
MKYSQCRHYKVQFLLFVFVFLTGKTALSFEGGRPSLAVYPAPATAVLNRDFTVKVRQNDQGWKSLPVYQVIVDKVIKGKHTDEKASMCYFDFSGEVEVSVTFNRGAIAQSRI